MLNILLSLQSRSLELPHKRSWMLPGKSDVLGAAFPQ